MMTKTIGNTQTFAIECLSVEDGVIVANVFVAGVNITPFDNSHYDQFFLHGALGRMLVILEQKPNLFNVTEDYGSEKLSDVFHALWASDAWGDFEVCQWAPCTSRYRCAIIRYQKQYHLCCCDVEDNDSFRSSVIGLSTLIGDLKATRQSLVSRSNNVYLQLDVQ